MWLGFELFAYIQELEVIMANPHKSKLSADEIKEYYKTLAEKFGADGRCTISDMNTRNLEIKAILNYLNDGEKILEVGCGNGFTAMRIVQQKKVDLFGIDISKEMIDIAKKRPIRGAQGKVVFKVGNVLDLDFEDEYFDTVFTERCLINLVSWNAQKKGILEIYRVLKKGGLFIMVEAFTDGWKNMNDARLELGLKTIPQPPHDLFFDKEKLLAFMKDKFDLLKEDNFLSTYYFGSRVLYPALLMLCSKGRKEPQYDSQMNSFFASMPSYGNHAPIKLLLFKKKYTNAI